MHFLGSFACFQKPRQALTFHSRVGHSGNFLMQALLAVALIMAFMPFISYKLASQKRDIEMNATTQHVGALHTAARIYLRNEFDNLPFGKTTLSGDAMVDVLEPFGLPLGFIPTTPFRQKISLIIIKNDKDFLAMIVLSGGDLSKTRRAELGRRIGFWAAYSDDGYKLNAFGGEWIKEVKDFGLKLNTDDIYIRIPRVEEFSELVRKNEKQPESNEFLTNLDMDGNNLQGGESLNALKGNFESVMSDNLVLFSSEGGRHARNEITSIMTDKAYFKQTGSDSALSITGGTLNVDNMSVRSISQFGASGDLNADTISVYEFNMPENTSSFTGPGTWSIKENAIMENVALYADEIVISSFLNAAQGQNIYTDDDGVMYAGETGIITSDIFASHITLRDQISSALSAGSTGAIILDIRPAGVSVLPDAFVKNINNDNIKIITSADDDDGNLTACKNIIQNLQSKSSVADTSAYNAQSLTQNLVCQYVFWNRLEQRINIKQCMISGGTDCN